MTKTAQVSSDGGLRRRGRAVAPYVLGAGAIWLAWQVMLQPVIQRGPPEIAVRLDPGSSMVLRRAAESELLAAEADKADAPRRVGNAAELARQALVRAPFDVRALRVIGLTEARSGREQSADDLLTLAGNWSLRDDPTHAWLVDHRLRRGDYASALAHADTLIRRRDNLRPQVFQLFSTAATQDPQRAMPVVARLVAARPPWRQAYLDSLYRTTEGMQLAINLAVLLKHGDAPLSPAELSQMYFQLLDKGLVEAANTLRTALDGADTASSVTNGGFDDTETPEPFQWKLAQEAGVSAEITPDDARPQDPALRVEYDGYTTSKIALQLMFLKPGRYRLTYQTRTESGAPPERLNWTMLCVPGEFPVLSAPAAPRQNRAWTTTALEFTIPERCPGQWLSLDGGGGDRRTPTVLWFDKVSAEPIVP